MTLLDTGTGPAPTALRAPARDAERDARRTLREQIAHLESELGACLATAFGTGPLDAAIARDGARRAAGPRLVGLGELEALRDRLADRVAAARRELEVRGAEQEAARVRLEAMLLAPGRHRFEQVTNRELGEGGCGAWRVKPRLGIVGMCLGWWEVKLSSGCP